MHIANLCGRRPITNKHVLITHIIRILVCVNRMQFVGEFQNRAMSTCRFCIYPTP